MYSSQGGKSSGEVCSPLGIEIEGLLETSYVYSVAGHWPTYVWPWEQV